jgi:SnoaL-like protein
MATTNGEARRAQLKSISEAYFAGLAKRDVSSVPWHDDIVLRSPLAPEGLEVPLRGKSAVIQWFESLYPVLSETRVIEHYFNGSLTVIATRADVGITEPSCFLRVVDRFTINASGQITEQENHYDPRPAIRPHS